MVHTISPVSLGKEDAERLGAFLVNHKPKFISSKTIHSDSELPFKIKNRLIIDQENSDCNLLKYFVISKSSTGFVGQGAQNKVIEILGYITVDLTQDRPTAQFTSEEDYSLDESPKVVRIRNSHAQEENYSHELARNDWNQAKLFPHLGTQEPIEVIKDKTNDKDNRDISYRKSYTVTNRHPGKIYSYALEDYIGDSFNILDALENIIIPICVTYKNQIANQGMVHRDMKSDNLLADIHNAIFNFIDVDSAIKIGEKDNKFGSTGFIAPEAFKGNSDKVTLARDMFSLGVILIAGIHPFAQPDKVFDISDFQTSSDNNSNSFQEKDSIGPEKRMQNRIMELLDACGSYDPNIFLNCNNNNDDDLSDFFEITRNGDDEAFINGQQGIQEQYQALLDLFRRMTSVNPALRPQSIDIVIEELENIVNALREKLKPISSEDEGISKEPNIINLSQLSPEEAETLGSFIFAENAPDFIATKTDFSINDSIFQVGNHLIKDQENTDPTILKYFVIDKSTTLGVGGQNKIKDILGVITVDLTQDKKTAQFTSKNEYAFKTPKAIRITNYKKGRRLDYSHQSAITFWNKSQSFPYLGMQKPSEVKRYINRSFFYTKSYAITNYLPGEPFSNAIYSYMEASDFNTLDVVKKIIIPICQAYINQIAKQDLVHCDITPDNILADIANSTYYFIDVDSAKPVTAQDDQYGSLGYVAPEAGNPGNLIDFSRDWYSLGVTLLFAINPDTAPQNVFQCSTPAEAQKQIMAFLEQHGSYDPDKMVNRQNNEFIQLFDYTCYGDNILFPNGQESIREEQEAIKQLLKEMTTYNPNERKKYIGNMNNVIERFTKILQALEAKVKPELSSPKISNGR